MKINRKNGLDVFSKRDEKLKFAAAQNYLRSILKERFKEEYTLSGIGNNSVSYNDGRSRMTIHLDSNVSKTIFDLFSLENENTDEISKILGLDRRILLRGGDLRDVDFSGEDLSWFNFSNAKLTASRFKDADVAYANFHGALLDEGALEGAKNLELTRNTVLKSTDSALRLACKISLDLREEIEIFGKNRVFLSENLRLKYQPNIRKKSRSIEKHQKYKGL